MSITREEYFKRIEERERQRAERIADGREIPPPYVSEIRAPVTDSRGRTRSDRISQGLSPTEEQRTTEGELLASKKSPSAPTPEPNPDPKSEKKVIYVDEKGVRDDSPKNITWGDPTPTPTGYAYSGELNLNRRPDESFDDYEARTQKTAQQLADKESQRLASENPGKEISVSLSTPLSPGGFKPGESLYLRIGDDGLEDDVLRKPGKDFERTGYTVDAKAFQEESAKAAKSRSDWRRDVPKSSPEDPNKKFFGERAPGKETRTDLDAGFKPYRREEPPAPKMNFTTRLVYEADRLIPGGQGFTKKEFVREWEATKHKTPIGAIQILGEDVVDYSRAAYTRFDENLAGKERFGAQQLKTTLSVTPGLSGFVRDREVTDKEVELYGGVARGFAKGVSAVGVEVGRSLQDPAKDIVLFGAGAGAGAVVKAFKPVSMGVSKFVSSQGVVTRSFLRGTGKGLKATGVVGVGGLVAADVAVAPDPVQRFVGVSKEFALVGAGFRSGFGADFKAAESFLFKKRLPSSLNVPRGGSSGWSVKGEAGVLRTGDKKVFGIQSDGGLVFQTQTPQTMLSGRGSGRFITDADLKAKSLVFKSPLGLPKGATGRPIVQDATRIRISLGVDPKTGQTLVKTKTLVKDVQGKSVIPGFNIPNVEAGQYSLRSYGTKKQGFESVRVALQDVKTGKLLDVSPSGYADLLAKDSARYRFIDAVDVFKFTPAKFPSPKPLRQTTLTGDVVRDEVGKVRLFATDPLTALFLNKGSMTAGYGSNLGITRAVPKSVSSPSASAFSFKPPSSPVATFAPSLVFKEKSLLEDTFNLGITRERVKEDAFVSAKLNIDSKVEDKSVLATGFLPSLRVGSESVLSSGSRSGSRMRQDVVSDVVTLPRIGTDVVVDTDVVVKPVIGEPIPPRIRDPRLKDPTPRPGGFSLPRRDRPVFISPSPRQPSKRFFGALKTARPGSQYIIAPGRKTAGSVRTIRVGGEIKQPGKKKKEFWWGAMIFAQKPRRFKRKKL